MKNKVVTTFASLLISLPTFNNAIASEAHLLAVDRANWMHQLYQGRENTVLRDMIIPGTHDSASYAFHEQGAISQTQIQNAGVGKFTRKAPAAIAKLSDITYGDAKRYAEAQGVSIYDQLQQGIRYFDMRLDKDDDTGAIAFHHGGISVAGFHEVMNDISRFARAHPKEVIIFDWEQFPDPDGSKGEAADTYKAQFDIFKAWYDHYLADMTYKPVAGQKLAQTSLQDIWDSGKNIVSMTNTFTLNHFYSDMMWNEAGQANSGYAGTILPSQLAASWGQAVAAQKDNRQELFSYSMTLTPGKGKDSLSHKLFDKIGLGGDVFADKFQIDELSGCSYPASASSLYRYTERILGIPDLLLNFSFAGGNVVLTDYNYMTSIVDVALHRNSSAPSETPSGTLPLVKSTSYELIWADHNSSADRDVSIWRPQVQLKPNGKIVGDANGRYKPLGYVTNHQKWTPPAFSTYLLDTHTAPAGSWAYPVGYAWAWDDDHSDAKIDTTVWRPLPPKGYVCLGDIADGGIGKFLHKPSIKDMVCVHESYATPQGRIAGTETWTDKGSCAYEDVRFSYTDPQTKLMYANRSHAGNVNVFPRYKLKDISTSNTQETGVALLNAQGRCLVPHYAQMYANNSVIQHRCNNGEGVGGPNVWEFEKFGVVGVGEGVAIRNKHDRSYCLKASTSSENAAIVIDKCPADIFSYTPGPDVKNFLWKKQGSNISLFWTPSLKLQADNCFNDYCGIKVASAQAQFSTDSASWQAKDLAAQVVEKPLQIETKPFQIVNRENHTCMTVQNGFNNHANIGLETCDENNRAQLWIRGDGRTFRPYDAANMCMDLANNRSEEMNNIILFQCHNLIDGQAQKFDYVSEDGTIRVWNDPIARYGSDAEMVLKGHAGTNVFIRSRVRDWADQTWDLKTVSNSAICPHSRAAFDGANCHVISKINGISYWPIGEHQYYSPSADERSRRTCDHHRASFDGANCYIYSTKAGLSYWNIDNNIYYTPRNH